MIVSIRNWQDTGKTALAVGLMQELVFRHGYDFGEVVANLKLKFPVENKPHCINNKQMKKYIQDMVTNGLEHKIIIIDEADRVFPARFWHKPEQTEALIGLWQDFKLFNYIIWTGHADTGVDLVLRSVTQMELTPEYDAKKDRIPFTVYNQAKGIVTNDCLLNVSKTVFPYYDRWERIL